MSRQAQLGVAVVAVVVAVIALLFDEVVGRAPDEQHAYGTFVVLSLVCVALAAAIFLFLIPLLEGRPDAHARLSLAGILASLLGLAALIVYWTAVPLVLGAGGAVMGTLGESRADRRVAESERAPGQDEEQTATSQQASQGWVARVLGALVFLACVVAFIAAQIAG